MNVCAPKLCAKTGPKTDSPASLVSNDSKEVICFWKQDKKISTYKQSSFYYFHEILKIRAIANIPLKISHKTKNRENKAVVSQSIPITLFVFECRIQTRMIWCLLFILTSWSSLHIYKQVALSQPSNDVAAGHFQKNQKKLSKNEGDDVHICKIWTKYFMYILSMLKFGVVCLFSQKIDKITIG